MRCSTALLDRDGVHYMYGLRLPSQQIMKHARREASERSAKVRGVRDQLVAWHFEWRDQCGASAFIYLFG